MTAPGLSISTANGRYYNHPRRPNQVPSITNIIGKKDKPGLKYWAARQSAEYAADNIDKLVPLNRDERIQLVRSAPFAKTDASGNGDIVHDWIDRFIKGETVPAEEFTAAPLTCRNMYKSFLAFNAYYKPTFVEAEFTVWSETYGYAGTADFSCSMNNTLILADTKTGNKTYPETGMQLASIAKADFILDQDGTERPIPKFERFAILHLRPTFFEFQPVDHIDECFNAFLGLKAVFDWEVTVGDSVINYAPKVKTSTVAQNGA